MPAIYCGLVVRSEDHKPSLTTSKSLMQQHNQLEDGKFIKSCPGSFLRRSGFLPLLLALFFAPPTELILCDTHTQVVVNRRLYNAKLNIALLILGFRFRRRSQKASRFYCGTGRSKRSKKASLKRGIYNLFSDCNAYCTPHSTHTHCSPHAFGSFYSFL